MNIFVLDRDPLKAAEYMCDKHIPKMVVETAQMLSTAHRIVDPNNTHGIHQHLYKTTHKNHPCTRWVCANEKNYRWLLHHFIGLAGEYYFRYWGKRHKSYEKLRPYVLTVSPWNRDFEPHYDNAEKGFLPITFAQAMPDAYKIADDPVTAYRNYYIGEKYRFAQWQRTRKAPSWWPKPGT